MRDQTQNDPGDGHADQARPARHTTTTGMIQQKERINPMATTVNDLDISQDEGMPQLPIAEEARLQAVITTMRGRSEYYNEQNNTKRLERAEKLYREGKVTCDEGGIYHVQGNAKDAQGKPKVYAIDKLCTCEDGQRSQSKWCAHLIATAIHRKLHAPMQNEPSLFAPSRTVDERLAEPAEPPAQEPPGSPVETSAAQDVSEVVLPTEVPLGAAGEDKTAMPPETLAPETLKDYRKQIVTHLFALGCKASTREEFADATMAYVGLVLAPENFPLIVERLQELLDARAALPPQRPAMKDYIVQVHGQNHIRFAGLLDLAHYEGLEMLSATFISVTPELALATATATFKDGRTFTDSADATPANVQAGVKAHFARMALTRAKARALRDALNIDAVSEEELA